MNEPERLSKRNAIRLENQQRILSAAEKVFAEAGFGGATMQLIADMAGLPKANLHYYFATKEDLYRRVVSGIFEIWLEAAASFDDALFGHVEVPCDTLDDNGLIKADGLPTYNCENVVDDHLMAARRHSCGA